MKTVRVKTPFKLALGMLACLTFIQVTAFAAAGGSSGNGNGDSAFALQELAKANPGLSDQQILIKAFEESTGRVPEIKWDEGHINDGYKVYRGKIFENEPNGIIFNLDEGAEEPIPQVFAMTFTKTSPLVGPLLATPKSVIQSNSGNFYSLGKTGLIGKKKNDFANDINNKVIYEFRSYTKKIIIYVRMPDLYDTSCRNMKYCSIGYFWID